MPKGSVPDALLSGKVTSERWEGKELGVVIVSILRSLGFCVVLAALVSCSSSKPELSPEQEVQVNEACQLYLHLFSTANDYSGFFPGSLGQLLSQDWDLDESLIYNERAGKGELSFAKWIYYGDRRLATTDDANTVLFTSTSDSSGVCLVVFVDGRILCMDRKGEVLRSGSVMQLLDKENVVQGQYPRFAIAVGGERLIYRGSWDADTIRKQMPVLFAAAAGSDHSKYLQISAGVMSKEYHVDQGTPWLYLTYGEGEGWHFMRCEPPNSKVFEYMRVDQRSFKALEEASDWYFKEYIQPILGKS